MDLMHDPIALALALSALTLVPLGFMMMTSFLKISVVLMIVRNALGIQQVPPTLALNGVALALTLFIMGPTFREMVTVYQTEQANPIGKQDMIGVLAKSAEPLRGFMLHHARPQQRSAFLADARQFWPPESAKSVDERDFAVLVPAFVTSELQTAFEIGFLIYLPFLVIDLIVSNVLFALGMQMVSPMSISLPIKLLLFVAVDGWGRLLQKLVESYT
jgi:type III secretion protein R